MSERLGFESAIDANPRDATNHLVYADWLDEQGEHDEAAFRRAMGEWVQNGGIKENLFHDGEQPTAADAHVGPFQIESEHSRNLPQGVSNPQFSHYYHPYHSQVFEAQPGSFHYNSVDRDPVPSDAHYHPLHGIYSWQTYRGMEEAFRRVFMRNLAETRASKAASDKFARVKYARARFAELRNRGLV